MTADGDRVLGRGKLSPKQHKCPAQCASCGNDALDWLTCKTYYTKFPAGKVLKHLSVYSSRMFGIVFTLYAYERLFLYCVPT